MAPIIRINQEKLDALDKLGLEYTLVNYEGDELDKKTVKESLNTPLDDVDMSVRLRNRLKFAQSNTYFGEIKTLGDLVEFEGTDFVDKVRNFGKKSYEELTEILDKRGLEFGMNISKYLE